MFTWGKRLQWFAFWSFLLALFSFQHFSCSCLSFVSIIHILFNFYSTPSKFSSMLSPILHDCLAQHQEFTGAELLQFLYTSPWVHHGGLLLDWSKPLFMLDVFKLAPSAFQWIPGLFGIVYSQVTSFSVTPFIFLILPSEMLVVGSSRSC